MKFVFFSLLLLSACAPTTWTQWRSDATNLKQAEANCKFEKSRATDYNAPSGFLNAYGANEVYKACMNKEGWSQISQEQADLKNIGMQNLEKYSTAK